MKTRLLLILMSGVLVLSSPVIAADVFDGLNDLTVGQRELISNVQHDYQTKNNELLNRILSYTDRIAKLKLTNSGKTPEEISLIADSYERNIGVLKKQQQILSNETESIYRLILNDKQYRQYQILQLKGHDTFAGFLQK